jgi:hypothetical protein
MCHAQAFSSRESEVCDSECGAPGSPAQRQVQYCTLDLVHSGHRAGGNAGTPHAVPPERLPSARSRTVCADVGHLRYGVAGAPPPGHA